MRTFAQKPETTQRPTSAKSKIASRAQSEQSREVDSILSLQRTIGNQAAQRLLQAKSDRLEELSSPKEVTRLARDDGQAPQSKSLPSRQGKFVVSSPGDSYEQEANRVSEQVMRISEPQCTCGGECPDCRVRTDQGHERTKDIQDGNTGGSVAPPIIHEVLAAPGQSLAATTRRFMEPRFGHDFGDLRVHTDAKAAESAEALGALAYTYRFSHCLCSRSVSTRHDRRPSPTCARTGTQHPTKRSDGPIGACQRVGAERDAWRKHSPIEEERPNRSSPASPRGLLGLSQGGRRFQVDRTLFHFPGARHETGQAWLPFLDIHAWMIQIGVSPGGHQ